MRTWLGRLARIFLSGQRSGVTPTIRREISRCAGIEPVIGHLKEDSHLGRNFLAGATGDAINVALAAAGHNMRFLRTWLTRLPLFLLSILAICSSTAAKPSAQVAVR